VVASGSDTTHGSMSRRARGALEDDGERRERRREREREKERVRAFLKRDSRTGADPPPHPRIFRLALLLPRSLSLFFPLSLSLFFSHLCIFLSRSLARSLSRVRPFFRSPFSPVLFLLYAPTSVVAATVTTPIASRSLPLTRERKGATTTSRREKYMERKMERRKEVQEV